TVKTADYEWIVFLRKFHLLFVVVFPNPFRRLLWIDQKDLCRRRLGLGLVAPLRCAKVDPLDGAVGHSDTILSSRISLEVMTLSPKCEDVETSEGVPITVSCIAQCKIMNEKELLTIACEQFLGKSVDHIKSVILQTLEGHLRSILGTMTVEEIYRERDQFASLIREVATPDVGRMGIEILSFTIKDVYDNVQYLESLGKSKIAEVKRNATVGVANAERDAGIREAECQKESMDVKYNADSKIENSSK